VSDQVRALSDEYVERAAALDPVGATSRGIAGHDDRMTDYSPDGIEARLAHDRDTRKRLADVVPETDLDRIAAAVLADRLDSSIDAAEAGEPYRVLRPIFSPFTSIRQVFDVMPRQTDADWETMATRMEAVPGALAGVRATLRHGVDRGTPAPRRQVLACAEQARVWAGLGSTAPYFGSLAGQYAGDDEGLRSRLTRAAEAASEGYADMASWFADELAPVASPQDAAGAERYRLLARQVVGADLDLGETYRWAWDELHRLESEMAAVADQIVPGASVAETIAVLEADPARAIHGEDNLRAYLQDLMDRTIAELNGRHFDIPEPIRTVEAMIAPPGSAAAMYYTGPSEDFSRPGRTWYPTLGKTVFPLWGEVSICYHEGVPGHHLQIGQVRYLADRLTRFQRFMAMVSGHGEGWALYAERLMDELGYFENPEYRLGFLRAQVMRAVRVVVDLGMHLQLRIPDDDRFHPGEQWTAELAQAFLFERSCFPRDFMASELDRYLGWPSQAICYKVGERSWVAARAEVEARLGAAFDLKAFHAYALNLGPMSLDQLTAELGRYDGTQPST
jgi:uncharacterized protein (DUF885 family)